MLPHVGLHTNPVKGVLAEEGQPGLHRLRVTILDLNQTAEGDPLKVLLALLVDKVTADDGPALSDAGKRHGARDGEVEVVRSAEGKIGKELEVLNTVGAQLEIADGQAVFGLAAKGTEV